MTTRSRSMRVFQIIWPVAALAYLVLVGLSIPGYFKWFGAGWPQFGALTAEDIASLISRAFSLASVLLSFGLAALLYWRGRAEAMALYFSYFLLFYGPILGGPMELIFDVYTGTPEPAYMISALLFGAPFSALLVLFPSGRPAPRWSRWLIPVSLVLTTVVGVYALLAGLEAYVAAEYIFGTTIALPTLAGLVAQMIRYRRLATPTERQQMKWALYGIMLYLFLAGLSSIPWAILRSLPPGTPQPAWQSFVGILWWVMINVIPFFFTLAILRTGLWNVDLVIRRTVTYSLLTALLAGLYLGIVLITQTVFSALIGHESTLAVVISTLVIAALFTPLRRRVQRLVNRRFFRQQYDPARTLADFADAIRDDIDLVGVESALLRAVNETMQPEAVGLWLREGGPNAGRR